MPTVPHAQRAGSAFPHAPDGLVYAARDIRSQSDEEPARQIVNSYVTTGCFEPSAPNQQVENLRWVGTLVADCDLCDFFFSEVIPEDKAEQVLTTLRTEYPSHKDAKLRKIAMYRWARKRPDVLARIRAKHLARIREALATTTPGVEPTKIIDSGWGYHLYWWLSEGATGEAITLARETNARLVRAINAAVGYSLADDGVHDAGTRILREVGSRNTKDIVGNPDGKVVSVIAESDSRWVLGETEIVSTVASATDGGTQGADEATAATEAEADQSLATIPVSLPTSVQVILNESKRAADLFAGQGKPATTPDGKVLDTSGSGYDMSLARLLSKKGCSQAEIAAALYLRNAGRKDLRHCNRTAATAAASLSPAKRNISTQADPQVSAALVVTKHGEVRQNLSNVIIVLGQDHRLVGKFWYEERTKMVMIDPEVRDLLGLAHPQKERDVLRDADQIAIRDWLSRTYGLEAGKDLASDAILHVARRRTRNLLREYLDMAADGWDQEPRLDMWLVRACACEDTPLTRAYARKFLIAAVARAYDPGCKVDTVLILKGPQGRKKSTLLRLLAGDDYFSDTRISLESKDAYLQIHRAWIYEFSELGDMTRKEAEDVKAFLTSQVDNFRAPYDRLPQNHYRQGVFVGSTNRDTFLNDPTGSRRYWPVTVGKVDVEWLCGVRDHLWGEAVHAYRTHETWWLEDDLVELHDQDAAKYEEDDPTAAAIIRWLGSMPPRSFTLDEALRALEIRPADFGRHRNRVADVLRGLGCTRSERARVPGERARVYPWTAPRGLHAQCDEDQMPSLEDLVVEESNVVRFPTPTAAAAPDPRVAAVIPPCQPG